MKTKKPLWNFLNGNKTAIGMLLLLLAQGSQAFFPSLMTQPQINFLETTGAVIGGIGVIHKGVKWKSAQELISEIKPKKN